MLSSQTGTSRGNSSQGRILRGASSRGRGDHRTRPYARSDPVNSELDAIRLLDDLDGDIDLERDVRAARALASLGSQAEQLRQQQALLRLFERRLAKADSSDAEAFSAGRASLASTVSALKSSIADQATALSTLEAASGMALRAALKRQEAELETEATERAYKRLRDDPEVREHLRREIRTELLNDVTFRHALQSDNLPSSQAQAQHGAAPRPQKPIRLNKDDTRSAETLRTIPCLPGCDPTTLASEEKLRDSEASRFVTPAYLEETLMGYIRRNQYSLRKVAEEQARMQKVIAQGTTTKTEGPSTPAATK